jgi:hypothetical protein
MRTETGTTFRSTSETSIAINVNVTDLEAAFSGTHFCESHPTFRQSLKHNEQLKLPERGPEGKT